MSVKAEPPSVRNQSGQAIFEAMQVRWMGSGGGELGAKTSFIEDSRVAEVRERAGAVRRALCRKSWRSWIEEVAWVPDRTSGRVKNTVATHREGEMRVEDMR